MPLSTRTSMHELALEKPEWLPVLRACLAVSLRTTEFAGAWVVQEMGRWIPSLRPLAARGLLEKVGSSRGGRRAYYRFRDRSGVEQALDRLERRHRSSEAPTGG